jgi:hypothetical protein
MSAPQKILWYVYIETVMYGTFDWLGQTRQARPKLTGR